jgi:hypothetical protein
MKDPGTQGRYDDAFAAEAYARYDELPLKVCVTCLLTTGTGVAKLVLFKGVTDVVAEESLGLVAAEESLVAVAEEAAGRPVAVATESGESDPGGKVVSGAAVSFMASYNCPNGVGLSQLLPGVTGSLEDIPC